MDRREAENRYNTENWEVRQAILERGVQQIREKYPDATEAEMALHTAKLAERDEAFCHALLSEMTDTLRGGNRDH